MTQRFFFLAFLILLFHQDKLSANERYPDLPVQITSLEWELDFNPSLSHFTSTANYTVRFNRDNILSFWMLHSALNIRGVKVNGIEVPTLVSSDSLRIGLRESSAKGTELRLSIEYQAPMNSTFFNSSKKVYWTSGFRTDIRSFIPIIDDPRIKFRTQITAHYPREMQFVTNGVLSTQIRKNDKTTTTTFVNRSAVPMSGLRLVLGQLEVQEVQLGVIPIRLYTISPDTHSVRNRALLEAIQSEILRMSTTIRNPYPFDAFHTLILPESFGQIGGDGAGIGYLFEDIGDLNSQASLIVSSQWLRQSIQTSEPEVGRYLNIYAQKLANLDEAKFQNTSYTLSNLDSASGQFSVYNKPNQGLSQSFKISDIELLLRNPKGLVSKEDLLDARYLDEWSYRPLPELPQHRIDSKPFYLSKERKAGFIVKVNRSEVPGEIEIIFEPYGNHLDDQYLLELNAIYDSSISKQSLNIRASGETILLNFDSTVRNLTFDWPNISNLDISLEKPLGYWLHQYRNTDRYELKLESARALADFINHHDLGDLVRDEIISKETDEYLSFIFRLWSPNYDYSLQSERMQEWLYRDVMEMDRTRLLNQLSETLSIEDLSALAIDYYNQTNSWDLHIQLIKKYFKSGDLNVALRFSEPYLASRYPFIIRSSVLEELALFDQNDRNWMNRIPDLAMDQDPRIRLKALMLSDRLNAEQRFILIKDRLNKERDTRILAYLSILSR
jgi:hypothetical protein